MILWLSYLHNGIFYTGKMTSLNGIKAQVNMQAGDALPPCVARSSAATVLTTLDKGVSAWMR